MGHKLKLSILALSLVVLSGCTASSADQKANVYMADQVIGQNISIVAQKNSGRVWLPLQTIAEGLGMKVRQMDGRFVIGATDPAYSLQVGSTEAFAGDRPVTLLDTPRLINNQVYITDRSVTDLWTLPVHWDRTRRRVSITPIDHEAIAHWLGSYSFRNSPTQTVNFRDRPTPSVSAMAAADPKEIVRFALQYQGTPFRLAPSEPAAGSAAAAGFDSSSFIRYVFGHFGIQLPRTALSQSEQGITVMDGAQAPGDLLFFGLRHGSRLVSHVGLYIGANRFIHTYGAPGVNISELSGEWRDRYLFAKRIR